MIFTHCKFYVYQVYLVQNDFLLFIIIHCLHLLSHVVLWLSGKSACLVNRRSLVQIRAVPHFQIILSMVIMFSRFICQNDFHPLSTSFTWCCGLAVKCACLVNRRSLVQILAVPHFQIILSFAIMLTRYICQMISIYSQQLQGVLWLSG